MAPLSCDREYTPTYGLTNPIILISCSMYGMEYEKTKQLPGSTHVQGCLPTRQTDLRLRAFVFQIGCRYAPCKANCYPDMDNINMHLVWTMTICTLQSKMYDMDNNKMHLAKQNVNMIWTITICTLQSIMLT